MRRSLHGTVTVLIACAWACSGPADSPDQGTDASEARRCKVGCVDAGTGTRDAGSTSTPPDGGIATTEVGRAFFDDFESGNTDKWDWPDYEGTPKAIAVTKARDGSGPHSGTYMLETNWNGGVDFNGVALENTSYPKYTREQFIRMWWRLDHDVDAYNNAKMMRLGWYNDYETGSTHSEAIFGYWGDPNNAPPQLLLNWFVGDASNTNAMPLDCWTQTWPIWDHAWHKIEIYIKLDTNDSDGAIMIWYDGQNADPGCGIPFKGDTLSGAYGRYDTLFLPSNWSNAPIDTNNHFYVDDVEIYTDQTRGGLGSMADGTIHMP